MGIIYAAKPTGLNCIAEFKAMMEEIFGKENLELTYNVSWEILRKEILFQWSWGSVSNRCNQASKKLINMLSKCVKEMNTLLRLLIVLDTTFLLMEVMLDHILQEHRKHRVDKVAQAATTAIMVGMAQEIMEAMEINQIKTMHTITATTPMTTEPTTKLMATEVALTTTIILIHPRWMQWEDMVAHIFPLSLQLQLPRMKILLLAAIFQSISPLTMAKNSNLNSDFLQHQAHTLAALPIPAPSIDS